MWNNKITDIFSEFIYSEFLSPKAIIVTVLTAAALAFHRHAPVLTSCMIAVVIIATFPFVWKEALFLGVLLAIDGLLRYRY